MINHSKIKSKIKYNTSVGGGRSTAEIGEALGLSHVRVSQIIITALQKMRKHLKKNKINLDDLINVL